LPRSRTRIALAHSHSWEFWGRPTGKVVIGLALVIIEFLRRSPERAADASATQT
jgi:cytochrome c-type biogenesis protein CcmH/NrfF